MTIYQILQGLKIPCVYSHFRTQEGQSIEPPFVAYLGAGQANFEADDTFYASHNQYQIEYYFTEKDEEQEQDIEDLLLDNGYLYTKSDDAYIEEMGAFVIYYQTW